MGFFDFLLLVNSFYVDQNNKFISINNSKKVIFNLIALPGSTEGVYMVNVTVDYVNHIGEERQDSYNSGIVIKSKPKMYVQIEEADVYKGKNTGEITVKFVNNDVADIKFLTAELMESEKYTILSPKRVYVGDLDSDDFESIDYRIKVKKKSGEILIPLKIEYKDSMNNPITGEVSAVLTMYNGGDIGKTTSNTSRNIIIFLIVVGGGYWFYKRWKKKRKKKY